MKPSLIVIYCLIVILPLGLLIGLGISLTRTERAQVEDQFQKVFEARLTDVDDQIQGFVKEVERQTLKTTGAVSLDSNAIRKIARENRRIKQVFILKADGKLLLPNPYSDLTEAEKAFLERTRNLLENDGLLFFLRLKPPPFRRSDFIISHLTKFSHNPVLMEGLWNIDTEVILFSV